MTADGRRLTLLLPCLMLPMWLLLGCEEQPPRLFQGYVEGEYVQVAAPLAGRFEMLAVTREGQVRADPSAAARGPTGESALIRTISSVFSATLLSLKAADSLTGMEIHAWVKGRSGLPEPLSGVVTIPSFCRLRLPGFRIGCVPTLTMEEIA